MIHVGTPLPDSEAQAGEDFLRMTSFNDGAPRWFHKREVVNATSQMSSLAESGVIIDHGFLSGRRSLISLIRAGFRLRKIVSLGKFDLVHVLWGSTTGLLAALFSPVPTVLSLCGSDLYGSVDKFGRITWSGRLSRTLSLLAAQRVTRIIVKSEAMRRSLPEDCRSKAAVVPNGVDMKSFYPYPREEARRRLGWSQDAKIVIFFSGEGGNAPVKNLPLAEAAAGLLRERIPNFEFRPISAVPHGELLHYYNAADLMLLTSFHEGSNNSLKEAISCGLPVVSVDCGDSRERLAGLRNCHVCEGRNPAVLAERAVAALLDGRRLDPDETVRSLSLSAIARRIIAVYEEAVR